MAYRYAVPAIILDFFKAKIMIPTFIPPDQMHVRWIVLLAFSLLFLTACQPAEVATTIPTSPPSATSINIPPSATPTLVTSPSATLTPTASETSTPLPTEIPTEKPTPTASNLFGIWERISDEHGNEYLFFGQDGSIAYAEANVANVEDNPSITGNYLFENGVLTITTEDCPGVTGTYTIRLIANEHLRFELVEDTCEGREDGLTFQPWQRFSDY